MAIVTVFFHHVKTSLSPLQRSEQYESVSVRYDSNYHLPE